MRSIQLPDTPSAVYAIEPMGAPRMTRADTWKKRPVVVRYRAFKDQVRALGVQIPEAGAHLVFVLPMPPSWPASKRAKLAWTPHRSKPDIDNLTKAILDAVFEEDSHVHDIRASKVWGEYGMLVVAESLGES